MEDYKLMHVDAETTKTFEVVAYEEGDHDCAHEFTIVMNVVEMTHNYGWRMRSYNFLAFGPDYGWDDDGNSCHVTVEDVTVDGRKGDIILGYDEIDAIVRGLVADCVYVRDREKALWKEFYDSMVYKTAMKNVMAGLIA